MSMTLRRACALAVLVTIPFLFGCRPQDVHWYLNDATAEQRSVVDRVLAELEAERRAVQAHPFLACVRAHESAEAGLYSAQNSRSTASGAYQFLDSTWRSVSVKAGHPGYARAVHAPWWVQDAVALWLYQNGGKSAWAGTGC